MPSYTMLNVKMQRESNAVPWGFRMQGGRDFGFPLQIQKVNPNSLAERCGIRDDDYILKIGPISAEYLQHHDAQEHIKRQNNILELILQRGSPPTTADYNSRMNFSPPTTTDYNSRMNFAPPTTADYNRRMNFPPQPQSPPPPQIFMPISNNRAISSNTYNTPIGLYSADNITDTLTRTMKSMNVASDYQTEEPKHFNEFKATSAKSMPKPVPFDVPPPQQPRPQPPYIAPPKPITTNKPLPVASGNRSTIKKGAKGSASLSQNNNANQIAVCYACGINIRGPFISAIGRSYCVDHFTCSNCSTNLVDCGFVEENGKLYCEQDFEQYLAPDCAKCSQKILKECVHALEKSWHPECFLCAACKKAIGTGSFQIEEGQPYCIEDYRKMFQAKCTSCEFPIEPGDKYLDAMGGTYHAECFTCSTCQVSLDGQGFVVKNNRPYCRKHGGKTSSIFF